MAVKKNRLYQSSTTVTSTAADIFAKTKIPRDVILQNNDAAGIVYVNLSGDATVSSTMFVMFPGGGNLEFTQIRNAVSAIGSIASNANVAVSEGR